MTLQGLWNVFDSYWTYANQSGQPEHPSIATDFPDNSPPSIGDAARPAPASDATPPGAPVSVDPYNEDRPFSAYDVVMLDDESGAEETGEELAEPDSEPIPSNVPGPDLRSGACMDPATKEKRRREIQNQIASLRSGCRVGNNTHQNKKNDLFMFPPTFPEHPRTTLSPGWRWTP